MPTAEDLPEMIDLVRRTEPGPFGPRTIGLGTCLGIRRERPFLHTMAADAPANHLVTSLGFVRRKEHRTVSLRAPVSPAPSPRS